MSPRTLFILGLLCLPALMLTQNPIVRLVLAAVYLSVYAAGGSRVRWAPIIALFIGITFAAVLAPAGRILFRLGSLRVTSGAIRHAVSRFALITGMVYLSRLSVGPSLHLPGRIGGFAGRVFVYLERLTAIRPGFLRGPRRSLFALSSWADALDRVLLEAFYEPRSLDETPAGKKKRSIGYPVVVSMLILSWTGFVLSALGIVPQIV